MPCYQSWPLILTRDPISTQWHCIGRDEYECFAEQKSCPHGTACAQPGWGRLLCAAVGRELLTCQVASCKIQRAQNRSLSYVTGARDKESACRPRCRQQNSGPQASAGMSSWQTCKRSLGCGVFRDAVRCDSATEGHVSHVRQSAGQAVSQSVSQSVMQSVN